MRRDNSISSTALASTAMAALTAAIVLLPLLGHKPLAEWDEGIYAEVAREMLGHSWLAPHWNGQLWFEKPPLLLWITAAFFKVFGVTEFWARAGSAFAGIGTVAMLHLWLARAKDVLAAWLSTLVLLGTLGFLHVCHVGETDVLLSLGCCVAVIGLALVDDGSVRGWYFFWLGFAIALMTKGAASIVLPLTAIIFAGLQRWRYDRLRAPFFLGLAGFLALVAPWHVAMYREFGSSFLDVYLGLHVIARSTQQLEGHASHWWYYGKVLLVSAPPFVLIYPFAVVRGLRRDGLRVWAVFALVVLLFFTLVQTRLPHYIAPAYPALSMLTAVWVADWLRPLLAARRPVGYWIKLSVAACAITIASVWITTPARKSLHSTALARGVTLTDNKDSIALLKSAFARPQPIAGPLLLLRNGRILSIATDVFYSRRTVQQVALQPVPAGTPGNPGNPIEPYMFNPEPLAEAVTSEPRLILLDRVLVASIPARFAYTPIQSQGTVELGTIVRTP